MYNSISYGSSLESIYEYYDTLSFDLLLRCKSPKGALKHLREN